MVVTRRFVFLCLFGLAGGPLVLIGAPLFVAGCTFTAYEKELVVAPPQGEAEPRLSGTAAGLPDESWMQFLDFNHIVDSLVELFEHTTAKEAVRSGVHYTERKRFLHFEWGGSRRDVVEEPQGDPRRADVEPANDDE
jgi:hypothetical protein